MFFNEDTERALKNRDTDNRRIQHDNQPLIKAIPNKIKFERKIGGSDHGVKSLGKYVSSMKSASLVKSGGSSKLKQPATKRQPTAWMLLVKKTISEKGLSMKEAIKYIKANNLY